MVNYKFNLNNKLTLLYDKCYNKDTDRCFDINNIDLKKIKMDNLKIPLDKWKDLSSEIISQLKGKKFQLLKSGDNYNIFKVYLNRFFVLLKISVYNREEDVNNLTCKINNDNFFSYLLSSFTVTGESKHIELPIVNLDADIKMVSDIFDIYPSLKELREKIEKKVYPNVISFRFRERFFEYNSMDNFFMKKKCDFRIIIFQVIHTLALIQDKYPSFRHNKLDTKSIFIYLKSKEGVINNYIFKSKKFQFSSKFDLKIGNFGFSSIDKHLSEGFEGPLKGEKNRYFDIHYFLGKMLEYVDNSITDCPELLDFMNRALPIEFRTDDNYLKNNVELFTPSKLLNDKYFSIFTKEIKKEKKDFSKFMGIKTRIPNIESLGNQNVFGEKISTSKVKNMYTRKIKNESKKSSNKKVNRSLKYEGTRKTFSYKRDGITQNTKKIEQKGGYTSFKQPYRKERNAIVSNEEKKIMKKRSFEQPRKKIYETPPVLAEQKIYDVRPQSKPNHPPTFPPTYVPLPNPYYPITGNNPYEYQPNKIPVQKFYNISLSNPNGDHTVLHRVFEDMLPDDNNRSYNTLKSRLQTMAHMRNTILKENDGEEMSVSGGEANSLLSYIRLVEINPFAMGVNPYYDMSSDMLLYGGAYPVRYDRDADSISIAKDSVGLNIRIYKLSLGAIRSSQINNQINFYNFDVWRDVYYYEYIRENILKKKVSPNFVMLLLYTKDKQSSINWKKIKMIKTNGIGGNNYNVEQGSKNEKLINNLHNLKKNKSYLEKFLNMKPSFIEDRNEEEEEKIKIDWQIYNAKLGEKTFPKPPLTLNEYKQRIKYNLENNTLDLTKQSNESLVAVTEGPTHNLLRWGSPVYESFGSVKKMISTGCHPDEVWFSILFQLVHSFIVLQEKGIVFDSFSIERNIFIKDINFDSKNTGHWVYSVGKINFYIPNYGYVLLIDSKYGDLEYPNITVAAAARDDLNSSNKRYKIYLSAFGSNGKGDDYFTNNQVKARQVIRKQFKEAINPDNFTAVGKMRGVGIPSSEVLKFMTSLYNETETNMRKVLFSYFKFFMHNRAGSLLTINEQMTVNMMKVPKFEDGELIVYSERFNTYRWGIYLGKSNKNKNNKVKVYLGKGNNGGIREIFKTRLLSVPEGEFISQNSSKNLKLDPESLIETYNLE
jgi:hypothetical protein